MKENWLKCLFDQGLHSFDGGASPLQAAWEAGQDKADGVVREESTRNWSTAFTKKSGLRGDKRWAQKVNRFYQRGPTEDHWTSSRMILLKLNVSLANWSRNRLVMILINFNPSNNLLKESEIKLSIFIRCCCLKRDMIDCILIKS